MRRVRKGPGTIVIQGKSRLAAAVLIEAVRREFGGLDILINNAGTTKRGDFFALTDAGGHQARILDSIYARARG